MMECCLSHPEAGGILPSAGARLVLAILERSVADLGGTYAMEDTDSTAIVATEHGELIECRCGLERLPNGKAEIK
jgi:hypothetical protein